MIFSHQWIAIIINDLGKCIVVCINLFSIHIHYYNQEVAFGSKTHFNSRPYVSECLFVPCDWLATSPRCTLPLAQSQRQE